MVQRVITITANNDCEIISEMQILCHQTLYLIFSVIAIGTNFLFTTCSHVNIFNTEDNRFPVYLLGIRSPYTSI